MTSDRKFNPATPYATLHLSFQSICICSTKPIIYPSRACARSNTTIFSLLIGICHPQKLLRNRELQERLHTYENALVTSRHKCGITFFALYDPSSPQSGQLLYFIITKWPPDTRDPGYKMHGFNLTCSHSHSQKSVTTPKANNPKARQTSRTFKCTT